MAMITFEDLPSTNTPINASNLNNNFTEIFNILYPVGSYYETSDTNFNPNTAWGGTWVEDSKGRTTIARGKPSQNSNTNMGSLTSDQLNWDFSLGDTLGEYTHQLVISEMPSHTHTLPFDKISRAGTSGSTNGSDWISNGADWGTNTISSTGGNGRHNTMMPSVVVIRWHRTA